MNIVSILNKLKETNMVSNTEEGISLFSDCFNKFGVSLLLSDEKKIVSIIDLLVENKIPLQKANGIYNLRIFAVDEPILRNLISSFSEINELNFLRHYPEILASPKNVKLILENMRKCQKEQVSYKMQNEYNMPLLLVDNGESSNIDNLQINQYLKSILKDGTLVDKVVNEWANAGEEDFDIALELQKVETKISEEFLYPAEDGWKIVIGGKEVNSFQTIKDTISKIIALNIPVTYNDALLFVLFYKTSLPVSDVESIINRYLFEGGM